MTNFKLLFNAFKRNKFQKYFFIAVSAVLVIFDLVSLILSIDLIKEGYDSFADYLTSTMFPLIFLSVIFMFFSYECFLKINSFKESITICKKSIISVYKSELLLFFCYISLLTLVTIIFNMVYVVANGQFNLVNVFIIVTRTAFYYVLCLAASVFIGLMLSFIKKRYIAYILILLFAVSSVELLQIVSVYLFEITGRDFSKLLELFLLSPHSITSMPNYLTVLTFDFNKMSLLLFYIVLSVFVVVSVSIKSKKEKFIRSAVCIALCVCLIAGYFMPFANPKYDLTASSTVCDQLYYDFNKDNIKQEPVEFSVKKYDLKLSAFLNLKADAKIYVDNSNLDEYKFTLYHKYKVKNITNQNGDKLDFKQDSDYLTVKANGETEYLNIKYYGGSSQYYSSYSGINLPGNLYFYPVAGFHQMFDWYYGFVCRALPNETVFNVEFDYPKTVYSNLEETGKNKFSGTADSLTFMSGYYKTEKIEDTVVYYSYMSKEYKVEDLHKHLDAFLKENRNVKKIFIAPPTQALSKAGTSSFDNYIITQSKFDIEENYFKSKIDYTKYDLYALLKQYYNPDTNAEELKQIEETANDEEKYQISVLKSLFASENREEAEEEIVDYLTDGKDLRAPSEFLTELGEKYA